MKLSAFFAVAAFALAVASPAHALFQIPKPTPVDRIVKNTEAQLAKTPEKIELRYQLARVHYLAYVLKSTELGIFKVDLPFPDELPFAGETADMVAPKQLQRENDKNAPELKAPEALQHAIRSAQLFQEVLKKEPRHMLAHLGLGSLLDQFATEAAKLSPKEIPVELAKHDEATLRQHYAVAFDESWKEERKQQTSIAEGVEGFVSYEAAQGYVRSATRSSDNLTDEEKMRVKSMNEAMDKLRTLPRGDITPLIVSVNPQDSIHALLAPEVAVDFDLRGFGAKERWPWLQAETGILVWDPKREGRITSAKQMFGSYSWQLFWVTGFSALAALDDNQDGWLRSAELEGISVWFDRNQNAISDAGEVTPLASLKVTALACSAPETEGRHPVNRHGVEFQNGSSVPLWDWVTEPLPPLRRDVAGNPR